MKSMKEKWAHEGRILLFLVTFLFSIEVLPSFFSFGKTSPFFLKYYSEVLPIPFWSILVILYFARLLIVAVAAWFQYRAAKKRAA